MPGPHMLDRLRKGRLGYPELVRCWIVTVTTVVTSAFGPRQALEAQQIPRNDYLRYVPLQYPSMVRQTDASAQFNLYGDTDDSSYRDADPIDGIDDRRHRVLLDLSVRFAPYLVQNTTMIPTDFRRFMNRRQYFPLFVDTWDVSSSTPRLLVSDEIEWVDLTQDPCQVALIRAASGNPDCRLLALLDEFGPAAPGVPRSTGPDRAPFTVMYFDFPGEDPETWQEEYENEFSGHLPRSYEDFAMIGAHAFITDTRESTASDVARYAFVLQYWFFYPFNDGGNNHEGDWEHINVLISPLDRIARDMTADDIRRILDGGGISDDASDRLVIKRVDYYFHGRVFELDYTRPNAYAPRDAWEQEVGNTVQERLGEDWYWEKTTEVFVRPFPDVSGGKWQVSNGGGSAPLWAHNGRELFYVADGKMYAVTIHPSPPFSVAPPRVLFTIPAGVRVASFVRFRGTFAITPDDQRFLMVRDNSWEEMAGTPAMVVVENFFDELRAKMKQCWNLRRVACALSLFAHHAIRCLPSPHSCSTVATMTPVPSACIW